MATLRRNRQLEAMAITYITTPEAAEQNAARRMRELGFPDVQVTGPGRDSGIDVRGRNAVAQVKWRGAQTGRPELQRLYGARGRDHEQQMLFFSASGYSREAIDYADGVDMALFTYDPTGALNAQSRSARRLIAGGRPNRSMDASPQQPLSSDEQLAKSFCTVVGGISCLAMVWFLGWGVFNLFVPEDELVTGIVQLVIGTLCAIVFVVCALALRQLGGKAGAKKREV